MSNHFKAINWNEIEDAIDKSTWEKLTEQFWLDTRIPLSNDLDDWRKLSDKERTLVGLVFGGLTLLDTLQSETGMSELRSDVRTTHEEAVLNNIQFMESVHAKSYSSIFSTLNTKAEIEEIFSWVESNPYLQKKAKLVNDIYLTGSPLQKKVASVFLESFLFYSGFFTPLYYLGNNKLANVAEIIKLIIRDESVHGTYIGYKFQLGFQELSTDEQAELKDWMYDLLYQLYE
ncbi:MAG: ribonucleotide-diphosphate reductase subunit beta, partial [Streptococcaceae bacterium]|nr:ribonucleotide-diphosphate reductase subunit beta [Streptococcaceae bacterium]